MSALGQLVAGATTFLAPPFAAAGPLAYPSGPGGALPAAMQLTPAAGPGGAVQPAVVPTVSLPPAVYAGPPPSGPRQPGSTTAAAFAATPAGFQPILYWYPSPPVSPQTAAPFYIQTTLPTTVLMKGLPPNIHMNDVLSFLDGLVEV